MILLELQGISMAPWLMPGDVVMIDDDFPSELVRFGDVVVKRNVHSKYALAHRVIGADLLTKGDRSKECDPISDEWKYEGRVVLVKRRTEWKQPRLRRCKGLLCKFGLYPGQKFPTWISRANLSKLLPI